MVTRLEVLGKIVEFDDLTKKEEYLKVYTDGATDFALTVENGCIRISSMLSIFRKVKYKNVDGYHELSSKIIDNVVILKRDFNNLTKIGDTFYDCIDKITFIRLIPFYTKFETCPDSNVYTDVTRIYQSIKKFCKENKLKIDEISYVSGNVFIDLKFKE
jgi:hypothetical protein